MRQKLFSKEPLGQAHPSFSSEYKNSISEETGEGEPRKFAFTDERTNSSEGTRRYGCATVSNIKFAIILNRVL